MGGFRAGGGDEVRNKWQRNEASLAQVAERILYFVIAQTIITKLQCTTVHTQNSTRAWAPCTLGIMGLWYTMVMQDFWYQPYPFVYCPRMEIRSEARWSSRAALKGNRKWYLTFQNEGTPRMETQMDNEMEATIEALGFRETTPIVENQMEKIMENEMEATMYRVI